MNHQKFPIYVAIVYFFHRAYRGSLENADNQHLRHVFPHVIYKQGLTLKIVVVATFFLFLLLYRKRKKELCCILLKKKKLKMCCQTLALILGVTVTHVYIWLWKDPDYQNLTSKPQPRSFQYDFSYILLYSWSPSEECSENFTIKSCLIYLNNSVPSTIDFTLLSF